jgi:hypothetical protein
MTPDSQKEKTMKRVACLWFAAFAVAGCEGEDPRPALSRGCGESYEIAAPFPQERPYVRRGEIGSDPSFQLAEERVEIDRQLAEERKAWEKAERQRIRTEADRRDIERAEAEAEEIRREQEDVALQRAAMLYEARALENARRNMRRNELAVEETVRRSRVMFMPPEAQRRLLSETGR